MEDLGKRIMDLRSSEESFQKQTKGFQDQIEVAKNNIEKELIQEFTFLPVEEAITNGMPYEEALNLYSYVQEKLSKYIQTESDVWVPKSYMPENLPKGEKIEASFTADYKDWQKEFKEYVNSTFSEDVKKFIFNNIKKQEGVFLGSQSYFNVAWDMFLKTQVKDGTRLISSGQFNFHREMIRNKYYFDESLNLTGIGNCNQEQAKHLYEQLQKRGINSLDVNAGLLKYQVKVDLRGLELDFKQPLFNLTDESIYTETNSLLGKNYKFDERNKFGVPILNGNGKFTFHIDEKSGLLSGYSIRVLDFDARDDDLGGSYPRGRVVVAKLRSN